MTYMEYLDKPQKQNTHEKSIILQHNTLECLICVTISLYSYYTIRTGNKSSSLDMLHRVRFVLLIK